MKELSDLVYDQQYLVQKVRLTISFHLNTAFALPDSMNGHWFSAHEYTCTTEYRFVLCVCEREKVANIIYIFLGGGC
jgi:hypothetical protein